MTLNTGQRVEEPEARPNDWTGLIIVVAAIAALGVFASWNWAFIVVAIIFMIFMHEMGHFLTAKLTGMKVTEFFIGFGPRIWSIQKGETEYGLKLIPAGAYVRIIGMNNLDPVEPGDEDRAYRVKSFPRKLLVVSAGSLMHFAMAIVLIFAFFTWKGVPDSSGGWAVQTVSEQSAAAALGIEPGDEIVSIDGIGVDNWADFSEAVGNRGAQQVEVVFVHNGETITRSTVLGARLSEAGAAAVKGLEEGDRILQIDGTDVFSWDDVSASIDGRLGEEIPIIFDPVRGPNGPVGIDNGVFNELLPANEATVGFFGVSRERAFDKIGAVAAAPRSVGEFGNFFGLITTGMWDTISGGALPNFVSDTVSGNVNTVHDDISSTDAGEREIAARALNEGNPDEERIISIYGAARIGSQITEQSFSEALLFMATLNISVGFLNLLPFPPLDGGHVVIASYERLRSWGGRRHEVDYNKVLPFTYVVFVLLVGFGLLAIFRDIIDPINIG